jgi:serine/threonine protein kinase
MSFCLGQLFDVINENRFNVFLTSRYQYTLRDYLSTFNPSLHERLILLTQLLEAVCHMRKHGIAHRDLKLDNIFMDTSMGKSTKICKINLYS